jgi:lipopolysaccharide export system protein LptA
MPNKTPLVELACLALLLAILPYGAARALPGDSEQPIHIEADRLEIDESRHISIYTGAVHMNQGSLNMYADKIIMQFDENNTLLYLDATGTPARFTQLNSQNKPVSGKALALHYRDEDGTLELRKQAELTSDQDWIESDFIRTNTRTNALHAGDKNGEGRVRMLIQPRTKSQP